MTSKIWALSIIFDIYGIFQQILYQKWKQSQLRLILCFEEREVAYKLFWFQLGEVSVRHVTSDVQNLGFIANFRYLLQFSTNFVPKTETVTASYALYFVLKNEKWPINYFGFN